MQQNSSKREAYCSTILPQETRKTLNGQPNFTAEAVGKRRIKKPRNQYKERNHKDLSRNKGKRSKKQQ